MKHIHMKYRGRLEVSIPVNATGLHIIEESYNFNQFKGSGKDLTEDLNNWAQYMNSGWMDISIVSDKTPYTEEAAPQTFQKAEEA